MSEKMSYSDSVNFSPAYESPLKHFSYLRYLNFCYNLFEQVGKQFDKKAKANFNIYTS